MRAFFIETFRTEKRGGAICSVYPKGYYPKAGEAYGIDVKICKGIYQSHSYSTYMIAFAQFPGMKNN